MAWKIRDEWIDLAAARHVAVFHNPDVLVDGDPVEHHLHHEFKLKACPHCGHAKQDDQSIPTDFAVTKEEVHAALTGHHRLMQQYREKHPNVRLGSGPK
jgi:hypothetical protein